MRTQEYYTPFSDYMAIIPTLDQEKGKILVDGSK